MACRTWEVFTTTLYWTKALFPHCIRLTKSMSLCALNNNINLFLLHVAVWSWCMCSLFVPSRPAMFPDGEMYYVFGFNLPLYNELVVSMCDCFAQWMLFWNVSAVAKRFSFVRLSLRALDMWNAINCIFPCDIKSSLTLLLFIGATTVTLCINFTLNECLLEW